MGNIRKIFLLQNLEDKFPLLPIIPFFLCCCSVAQWYPTLCNLMGCSISGFPVLHYLLEFSQTHFHWVGDRYHPTMSSSVIPFSSCLPSFPASGPFPRSRLFALDVQNIGASASASVHPMNIQGWFPLRLTGLISFLSTELLSLVQYHYSIPPPAPRKKDTFKDITLSYSCLFAIWVKSYFELCFRRLETEFGDPDSLN